MAEFIITGPDGEKYKVTGPDQAGAIAAFQQSMQRKQGGENVVATTPDGGRFIKQDGGVVFTSPGYSTSDPETVARLRKGDSVKEVVQSTTDQQTISQAPFLSRATKYLEGIPFLGSRVDEAAGGVSQALESVGIGQGRAQQGTRAVSDAMQRERPGESTALQLAGGVTGSIPLAMVAAPYLSTYAPASRLGQVGAGLGAGVAAGGTEGVVYGSGQGTNREERIENAQRQGAIGATLGGILGMAGPIASDLTEAAFKQLKRSDVSQIARRFGIGKPAAKVVKQHVDAGDIEAARRALSQGGDEAMLGEATKGSQSLLDAAAARGGRAETVVNDAIEGRVARGNSVFRQASDDAMGAPPQGIKTAADEVSERTAPQRTAAYDAAYDTPIDYATSQGRAVEEVLDRVPPATLRNAIQDANEELISLGRTNQQILADIADDGSVTFREMPNVQQLDQLKRSLDRLAKRDDFGRIAPEGVRPSRLSGQVRDATVEATGGPSGPYAKALSIGGDKIAEDNALRLGNDLLKDSVTRDDVIRAMANASTDARNSAKVGFRNAINEMMDNVRTVASDRNVDAREVKKIVDRLSSKAMRDKARIILGPDEAGRFFATVDELTSGLNLRAAVSENSRTARRQAVNSTMDEASGRNFLQSAATGEPLQATRRVVQLLTGETPEALAFRQEGVAEEIARFLTQTKGKSAEAALNYINKAMAGQALTDAQANFVAKTLATTGFLSGNRAGQQSLAPPR